MFRKYFSYYIGLYKNYFWLGVLALTFTNLLDVVPPLIIMKGVDQITGHAGVRALLQTALIFAGITVALAIVRFHWRMQFGKFHQNLAQHLRQRIFNKLTELGPAFYTQNSIGELMSLITNDVETIRMGMGPGLIVLIDAFLYFLTIPPIMISLSLPLTIKTLILLPFLPVFIRWLGGVINRRFLEVQDRFSELSGITQENITGIRVVKSYVQEGNQINIFNQASKEWEKASMKVAWAETFMHPVMEFCVTAGVVVLLYAGSRDVMTGALTLGAFVAFQRYISKMVWPMTAIGWGFSLVAQARASMKRVDDFLTTEPEVPSAIASPHSAEKIDLQGPIEVRNLTFRYPGSHKNALDGITVQIKPGDTLGIVGPVGSGKTTLAQLFCRLYAIDRDHIFINGHDINDVPAQQLRRHISLVPQDAFLFSASISENMTFGADIHPALEGLKRVAQIAKIDDEIESLPQRYDTLLGERGVNLSGGQKQRVTITRALLRKSPVIIFDDSLSAVDSETETLILNRLKEETKNHTTIIISHRLSSLSLCDRILVLKDGHVEAMGSPAELRIQSLIYQQLLQLQGYL